MLQEGTERWLGTSHELVPCTIATAPRETELLFCAVMIRRSCTPTHRVAAAVLVVGLDIEGVAV